MLAAILDSTARGGRHKNRSVDSSIQTWFLRNLKSSNEELKLTPVTSLPFLGLPNQNFTFLLLQVGGIVVSNANLFLTF